MEKNEFSVLKVISVLIKATGIPQIRICDILKYSDNFLTLKEFSEFQKLKEFFDYYSLPHLSASSFGLYVIQLSAAPDLSLIKLLLILLTPRKRVHNDTE